MNQLLCVDDTMQKHPSVKVKSGEIYHWDGTYECPGCKKVGYRLTEFPETNLRAMCDIVCYHCGHFIAKKGAFLRAMFRASRFVDISEESVLEAMVEEDEYVLV